MVWARGGSGSFSMLANRNASGHEVNASTREGDRLIGTGNAMDTMVRRGCRSSWCMKGAPRIEEKDQTMGMKVHVLYGKPTDPAAFEEYYRSIHAPIAAKLPGLQSFEYGKAHAERRRQRRRPTSGWPRSRSPTPPRWAPAMGGPEGQAAADDVPKFASGGVTVVVSEF